MFIDMHIMIFFSFCLAFFKIISFSFYFCCLLNIFFHSSRPMGNKSKTRSCILSNHKIVNIYVQCPIICITRKENHPFNNLSTIHIQHILFKNKVLKEEYHILIYMYTSYISYSYLLIILKP